MRNKRKTINIPKFCFYLFIYSYAERVSFKSSYVVKLLRFNLNCVDFYYPPWKRHCSMSPSLVYTLLEKKKSITITTIVSLKKVFN